jgi:hypothetical protein
MLMRVAAAAALFLCGVTAVQAGPDEIPKPLKDVNNNDDVILITVEQDKVGKDEVEFVLKIAPKISWHKKIKAFSATGVLSEIEVRDDIKEAKTTLKIQTLDKVEIGKAAFGNTTHWDYKISDLRQMGGCRIILSWEKD